MSYYGGGGEATLPQPLATTDAPRFARLGLGTAATSGLLATSVGLSVSSAGTTTISAGSTSPMLTLKNTGTNASSYWPVLRVNIAGSYHASTAVLDIQEDGVSRASITPSGATLVNCSTANANLVPLEVRHAWNNSGAGWEGLKVKITDTASHGNSRAFRVQFGTTDAFAVAKGGNIVVGSAALATNAADGYPYIPSCPGTPTQAPTAYTGRVPLVYDSSNSVLYAYNGSWKRVDAMPINTKGDLLVHTGSSRARLGVGTNGQVLTADSSATNGMAWKAAPGAWSSDNLTILTRAAMQSLLSWESPYDATRTNVIEWDVETHDGLGVWSAEAPKLITIAASGWYSIAAHLPVVMNSWSRACVLLNQDNFGSGTGYLESIIECIPTGSSADPKVHRVIIPAVQLSAGDVLRVVVVGYAAGNTGTGAEHCKLWLQRLA